MATSCSTWSRLTKVTVICPRGHVPILHICTEVVVQCDSNRCIFSKGSREIDIGE